jgi:DNA repair ATPase RecN
MWFNPRVHGPRVLPGEFKVRFSVSKETFEQTFEVRLNPRIKISKKEIAAYDFAVRKLARMQLSVNEAMARIQLVERQLSELKKSQIEERIKRKAEEIRKALADVRVELRPNPRFPETLSLESRISSLRQQIENCTTPPTRAQAEWIDTFDEQLNRVLDRLQGLLEEEIGDLNSRLSEAGIPPLVSKGRTGS